MKILILEDVLSDADLIQRFLRRNNFTFTAKVVDNRNEFVNALEDFLPDCILSDHSLPQFDSFDALGILKEKNSSIPFILVTGTVSEEFAAVIINEGADDYILKNNLTRLPNAIYAALKKKRTEIQKKSYQSQLEDKIKEMNTFIYRISHDLKAPLASTFGLIGLIRNEIKDEQYLGFIDLIEKSNKKMEAILMSFAEVVKIAQQTNAVEIISLKNFVEEIIFSLKNIPQAEGIKFTVKINPIDPGLEIEFTGNREVPSSVLQNLIHNSINYRRNIPDSFISVNVAETKNSILINVSDNGIGIEKELQPKIFEMFYRATIASKGSGLGLYIVKSAVEKLGGTIQVKSKIGEGSAFIISLPK